MTAKTEMAIGTLLALLGGIAFTYVIYHILSGMFNFPFELALALAVIVGALQYFILRYVFLVVGGRKGNGK